MKDLILSMMVSLDGYVARPDGNLDWFRSDGELEAETLALLRDVDAMVFGRVSYLLLAEYWPAAGATAAGATAAAAPGGLTGGERGLELARLMNSIPKIVVSGTLRTAPWGPATIVGEGLAEELTRMKREARRDLVCFAGADLAFTLMSLGLVDQYRLLVHPIVLGTGIPLFHGLEPEQRLELTRTRTFPSGVVLLHYRRDRRAATA
ncbi:MAG TPA: dihydrofolate reductase family protein [Gemmatimonadales bacterium]|nr:dihydrofolate reductase family protein [Gemmatimonadales bacterium]